MTTELTWSDIDDLRLSTDRLKLLGRYDSGVRLHTLLDAYEAREDSTKTVATLQEQVESLTDDVDQLKEALGEIRDDTEPPKKQRYSDEMTEDQLRDEVDTLRGMLKGINAAARSALL